MSFCMKAYMRLFDHVRIILRKKVERTHRSFSVYCKYSLFLERKNSFTSDEGPLRGKTNQVRYCETFATKAVQDKGFCERKCPFYYAEHALFVISY